jgi:hypothetical protein
MKVNMREAASKNVKDRGKEKGIKEAEEEKQNIFTKEEEEEEGLLDWEDAETGGFEGCAEGVNIFSFSSFIYT